MLRGNRRHKVNNRRLKKMNAEVLQKECPEKMPRLSSKHGVPCKTWVIVPLTGIEESMRQKRYYSKEHSPCIIF
jgi:hypothetical protein